MNNFQIVKSIDAESQSVTANIYIHDEIGGYGRRSRDFVQELRDVEADVINLRLDSVGGDVTDGTVIYNALLAHPARVDVYIDGIAASIASVIALAGDNVYIPENGAVMVHLPMISFMEYANINDLEEASELLQKTENVLTRIYEKHTGQSVEVIKKWYEKDTWFFGQEAVDAGFATKVIDPIEMAAKATVIEAFSNSQYSAVKQTNKENNTVMSEETITEEVIEDNAVLVDSVEAVDPKDAEIASLKEQLDLLKAEAEEKDEAQALLNQQEEERKVGINALSEKYDVDGDLATITNTALSGHCSVEDFKELVLDVLAQRPSTKAVKQSVENDLETVEGLRAQISQTTNHVEKNLLARKLRELR